MKTLPIFWNWPLQIYLIGSNVSYFENRKKVLNHSMVQYSTVCWVLQPCYWEAITRDGVDYSTLNLSSPFNESLCFYSRWFNDINLDTANTFGYLWSLRHFVAIILCTIGIRGSRARGLNPRGDTYMIDTPWLDVMYCTDSWFPKPRIHHAKTPKPVEASAGRSLKLMDSKDSKVLGSIHLRKTSQQFTHKNGQQMLCNTMQ